jgi:hypothetical protein
MHEKGRQEISSLVLRPNVPDDLTATLGEISRRSFISEQEKKDIVITARSKIVDDNIAEGHFTEEQQTLLSQKKSVLSLTDADLSKTGAYERFIKSLVLREVMTGQIPSRFTINGPMPINLRKGEKVVWGFTDCPYYEDITHRHYVGGSRGVSVRIAKGVYYRTGVHSGHVVNDTETVHADTGFVAVTDRHIYFAGPKKSFRVPYEKIVSFRPFADGLGFLRDAASAKPQTVVTGDGWFIYNLVTNLSQM